MGHGDGRDLQIVQLVLSLQPLQGEVVPHNHSFLVVAQFQHGFPDVLGGDGVVAPVAADHQVVAQAALVDNDFVVGQVVESLDEHGLSLRGGNTLGEQRDRCLAIVAITVMKAGGNGEHQVGPSFLEVVENVVVGLQASLIGDVEPVEDESDQFNAVAIGGAVFVQESVGPQIPGPLVDERMLLGVGPYSFFWR